MLPMRSSDGRVVESKLRHYLSKGWIVRNFVAEMVARKRTRHWYAAFKPYFQFINRQRLTQQSALDAITSRVIQAGF
jgi:hypothetical protein